MVRKLILFLVLFSSCSRMNMDCKEGMMSSLSPRDQLMYKIIHLTSNQMHKKYNIDLAGEGGATDTEGRLTEIIISFQGNEYIKQDEGRKIIINIVQNLIENVNNNKEILPYLSNYPFELKNISVTLLLPDVEKPINPMLAAIIFSGGSISYHFEDPHNPFQITSIEETYEEAFRKVTNY